MGFSVSASAAVLFIGVVVMFTTLYPVAADGFERVSTAEHAADEDALDQRNTAVRLVNASYDAVNASLLVVAENVGTAGLPLSATDLLVDNEYRVGERSVGNDTATGLWLPGERLRVALGNVSDRPDRVTVVTEHGVSAGVSP